MDTTRIEITVRYDQVSMIYWQTFRGYPFSNDFRPMKGEEINALPSNTDPLYVDVTAVRHPGGEVLEIAARLSLQYNELSDDLSQAVMRDQLIEVHQRLLNGGYAVSVGPS
jgi:hypothetical protein